MLARGELREQILPLVGAGKWRGEKLGSDRRGAAQVENLSVGYGNYVQMPEEDELSVFR